MTVSGPKIRNPTANKESYGADGRCGGTDLYRFGVFRESATVHDAFFRQQ